MEDFADRKLAGQITVQTVAGGINVTEKVFDSLTGAELTPADNYFEEAQVTSMIAELEAEKAKIQKRIDDANDLALEFAV